MSQRTVQPLGDDAIARLLEVRRMKKSKTPKFQRQESWRYVRIHDRWRKPKGVDSHMRLSIKGWPPLVKIGYGGPMPVRGLHPSGYRDVLIHNMSELETLSSDTDAARFSGSLGRRKRIELAKRAKELGIHVLNGRGLLTGLGPAEPSEEQIDKKEVDTEESKEAEVSPSEDTQEKVAVEETPSLKKKTARKTKRKKASKKKPKSSQKKPKKKSGKKK